MKTALLSTTLLSAVLLLTGCKDKTVAAGQPQMNHDHASAQQVCAAGHETCNAPKAEAAQQTSPEQTTCPVMGGKINKELFVEYQGKKVYFCCPGCKPEFEKNPEKYLSKLPQFQQQP